MSAREWKPGDVGIARSDERFIVTVKGDCFWPGEDSSGNFHGVSGKPDPTDRPLVVIDPEDAEQVNRLADAFCFARWSHIDGSEECDPLTRSSMRAALREFANPTPPKPDEPSGLGAVVEDADGHQWARAMDDAAPWCRRDGGARWAGWKYVDAVRVLSEGVPS
jgi:hypothetical protein